MKRFLIQCAGWLAVAAVAAVVAEAAGRPGDFVPKLRPAPGVWADAIPDAEPAAERIDCDCCRHLLGARPVERP